MGEGPEPLIFLSYRRDDVPFAAMKLYEELAHRFGEPAVFLDVPGVADGEDFEARIQAALDCARVVVVLIGNRWFAGKGPHNRRPIDDPDNWVHREVAHALEHGIALPVLVGEVQRPEAADFPCALRGLTKRQANHHLRQVSWERDVAGLVAAMEKMARLTAREAPLESKRPALPTTGLGRIWSNGLVEILDAVRLANESVSLVDVFVDPGVVADVASEDLRLSGPADTLLELVRQRRGTWVLLGDPGSGKSTLLRYVAVELAKGEDLVPVHVSLAIWSREAFKEEPVSLWEIAARRVSLGHREQLAQWLMSEHEAGRAALLLDGFDEVVDARQPWILEQIQLLRRSAESSIVVASRPIGQGALRKLTDCGRAQVRPLSVGDQQELLRRYLPDAARREELNGLIAPQSPLTRIASNPLLLSLLAWLAGRPGGRALPTSLSELYDDLVTAILEAGHKVDGDGPVGFGAESEEVLPVLAELSLRLTEVGSDEVVWPRRVILEALSRLEEASRQRLQSLRDYRNDSVFVLDVARTGLWSESEGPGYGYGYRFLHRSLGEALAARELKRRLGTPGGEAWVVELARRVVGEEARWAEVFALFVARVSKGDANAADRWLLQLAEANPALARRALCWVDHASPETVEILLDLPGDDLDRRCALFGRIEELVGDPAGAARLLGRLAARTADCQELWFLAKALDQIAEDPRVGTEAQGEAVDALSKKLFASGFGEQRPKLKWRGIRRKFRTFKMGSPDDEDGRHGDESPRHPVAIEKPYWLAETPITNGQWRLFRSEHPKDDDRPVVNVTWYEAAMFCRWLGARLPSEAEWECAARSGTTTRFCSGNADGDLAGFGWYAGNANAPMPVGQKNPNASGLHDMHGNVLEWCEDRWHSTYDGAPRDGSAWVDGLGNRVVRGGAFHDDAGRCRSAYRNGWPQWYRHDARGLRPASSSLSNLTPPPSLEPSPASPDAAPPHRSTP